MLAGNGSAFRATANRGRLTMMQAPGERKGQPESKLLTANEAAQFWRVSTSFLAKARMTGNGRPFIKIGRSVRYSEATLLQWMKSQQRLSTSEK
jgi:predicted DNA-binding transcriptional regulator AlpA